MASTPLLLICLSSLLFVWFRRRPWGRPARQSAVRPSRTSRPHDSTAVPCTARTSSSSPVVRCADFVGYTKNSSHRETRCLPSPRQISRRRGESYSSASRIAAGRRAVPHLGTGGGRHDPRPGHTRVQLTQPRTGVGEPAAGAGRHGRLGHRPGNGQQTPDLFRHGCDPGQIRGPVGSGPVLV